MTDRRSYGHNLSSCQIKAWEKIQAWTNPNNDLCDTGAKR